jgi:hypothetical protein
MEYLKFSLLFTLVHALAYTIAGAIALGFSKDIYETKDRHATFLRDMSNEEESRHVSRYFLPAQIVRGLLMSLVLLPLLPSITALSFGVKVAFFSGLMFIYTHLAAVSPFLDNIEGLVYFKEKYLVRKFFLKFQVEMILYSVLFGLLIGFGMRFVM